MSGGGSGGSGEQRYNWNETLAPQWADAISWGRALTDPSAYGQYRQYGGERIAGLDPYQQEAMNSIAHYTRAPEQFLYGQGNNMLQNTVQGDFLGSNPATGMNRQAATSNLYQGESPEFQRVLDAGMGDITQNFQQAVMPDINRQAVMAGAFGGRAHERATANAQDALTRNLGRYQDEQRNRQFERSAGLEEQRIGRMFNAGESALGREFGAHEGERGRMMQAGQMSQADQGLTLQRMNAMMGIGDINRGLYQDRLNLNFNDWQEQNNHQYRMLDLFSGLLSRAQGGMSPNSTFTPATYGANPFSQILGAGLLGASVFGG